MTLDLLRSVRSTRQLPGVSGGFARIDETQIGRDCAACLMPFRLDDKYGDVILGPGRRPERGLKKKDGMLFSVDAVAVDWDCIWGRD